jgi:hypothetical protein
LALEADMDEMETLTMSSKELNRLEVLGRVLERRPTRRNRRKGSFHVIVQTGKTARQKIGAPPAHRLKTSRVQVFFDCRPPWSRNAQREVKRARPRF